MVLCSRRLAMANLPFNVRSAMPLAVPEGDWPSIKWMHGADDVQVGSLGPIADRALRAGWSHRGLFEQHVVLFPQFVQLMLVLLQG